MKTCVACGERNPDRARFCMSCATQLGSILAADRRKVVTVLFADMKGSTQLGERLEPEALRSIMTRFYASARGILERHGGTVEKFIGDAVMCVFGVPRVHEDDPLRACRAAIGLRDAVEAMNAELIRDLGAGVQIRTGVNTGEVVAGDPALGSSFVSGDAVNVAARFEQSAEPGEILIGGATRGSIVDVIDAEAVEPLTLKGKSEPVPAFRLLAVRDGEARRRLVAPLTGRDQERGELLDLVRSSAERRGPVVAIVAGPPGIGKTRLLEDLRFAAELRATVLSSRYGQEPDQAPMPALIRQALAIEDAGAASTAVESLLEGREQAAVVAETIERLLEGRAEREPAAWAAQQVFSELAAARPTLVLVDDGQVAEPAEIGLLRDAVTGSSGPVTLVVGARPEFFEDHAGWLDDADPPALILELGPLAAAAAERIVEHLLGGAVDPALRASLVETAGGNPLFLGETLRMLLEEGAIRRSGGGAWEPVRPLEALAIPTTVRAVLAARIDLLPDVERAVVDAAAVLGSPFEHDAVVALLPDAATEVPRALTDLVRRELLAELPDVPGGFRFRQTLLGDVASGLLTRETAAVLHERAAEHLEGTAGAVSTVAEHLDRALTLRSELGTGIDPNLLERTAAAAVSAGEELLARGDGDGALGAAVRAVELRGVGDGWQDDAVRRRAADLAYRVGAWDEVIALLEGGDVEDPEFAEHLGVALTKRFRDDAVRLAEGRALLELAVERGADPEAAASLAGTWKGVDEDRARSLYLRAHELDPSHPYALGNLLEYEIDASGDLTPVSDRRVAIDAAADRCARQAETGENVPWAWYDLAKFRLLLGDANGALTAYATAIGRSVAAFQVATSSSSLDRLAARASGLPGLEEARRLLRLGGAARFGSSGDDPEVRALATPGAWPLAPPVAILAGGSSDAVEELVRGYADVFRDAFDDRSGTIISGGTRQGISELAGDLGAAGARVIGYLPDSVPMGVTVDDDPRRYAELRRSDGEDFGVREPIRYWADVLTSGIDPRTVRVVALAGGAISAFEYRLALALGARVGAVRGSGDAARELLTSSTWSASGRVEELEPEPDAIRAFLGS